MHIVWFKRDLRVEDHEALLRATKKGRVLPLYILEPELWQQPDVSYRQYVFLRDCLEELDKALTALGQGLVIKIGDAVSVLEDLHARYRISALWSHQETWNAWTYERDKRVQNWLKKNDILWIEPTQNGVIRRLKNRDGWASRWQQKMSKPPFIKPVSLLSINEPSSPMPLPRQIGLDDDGCTMPQKGGRREGLRLLYSFLHERGQGYTKEMSSPETAFESCSRLSAHIAFGTISIREIVHAVKVRYDSLQDMPPESRKKWSSALRSFSARLRWHCHFIQKLEDEPRIEFENLHPGYDGLRENNINAAYFEAWKTGHTGYPMVDACMRALIATGWLNFRMRAMLMSFASYHLWLHWREPALYLASLFTDYEPGIHYSQVQMQSGTTGINSIRIYNPIKQGVDHCPKGMFIRQWIPELADVDDEYIHTPWLSPNGMNGYPLPIVDEKLARTFAASKLYERRKQDEHRAVSQKIVKKHGSRKSIKARSSAKKGTSTNSHPQQYELSWQEDDT